jgi:hypothetical protein
MAFLPTGQARCDGPLFRMLNSIPKYQGKIICSQHQHFQNAGDRTSYQLLQFYCTLPAFAITILQNEKSQ